MAALWDPRPVSAETLKNHLLVEVPAPTNHAVNNQKWKDIAVLFLRCVHRYLEGRGHPEHEDTRSFAGLSTEDFEREANNPHIRSCLLLETFTESRMCPTDAVPWSLVVRSPVLTVYAMETDVVPPSQFKLHEPQSVSSHRSSAITSLTVAQEDQPLWWVCCSKYVKVPAHRHLLNKMMASSSQPPHITTDFDAWLHCEMMGALKFFNRS